MSNLKASRRLAVIDACGSSIKRRDDSDAANPPGTLYHLTDTRGFVGIVSSKRLWASLVTSLNDASEVQYGLTLAADILRDRLASRGRAFDRAALEYLLDPSSAPLQIRSERFPLVVSFCGDYRKSGQWLNYGRSGRGIAVGFAPSIAKSVKMDFSRVDYEPAYQRGRVTELFDAGETALGPSPTPDDVRFAAYIASTYVPWLAVRMKDPSFSEEEEWRLSAQVHVENGKIQSKDVLKYREVDERLIPYVECEFADEKLLQEVVIGYSSPMTLDAARPVLRHHGFASASVHRSPVPVR